ncbi:hypothetical protein [Streptomyces sp. ISL-86]|uniref:hypothetical protein n=1 Tax=Streptomyces sp. ISL-86 TaxID=2819187 RepID=UPI001BEC6D1E|nr:hypothetical protein [Streptomyces sp. ISL-86]MBT2456502.1 hypothetical protein [Streptomyces sp. ISL-86]
MIAEFTVRQNQGDPSGFDLGDMFWRGELGEANSAGHEPDQGMMIYISVTQLLDCLSEVLQGHAKATSFTGADTSFGLTFRSTNKGVSVAARSGPVTLITPAELAQTALSAAEELARNHLESLPSDGVRDDYLAALNSFRLIAAEC